MMDIQREVETRYTTILKEINKGSGKRADRIQKALVNLAQSIKEHKAMYDSLMASGELPFPEEAQENLEVMKLLYGRLELLSCDSIEEESNPSIEDSKPLVTESQSLSEAEEKTSPLEELNNKSIWTIKDLQAYTGFSRSKIYKLTMNGLIPLQRIGRDIRFRKVEIDAWLEEHGEKALF